MSGLRQTTRIGRYELFLWLNGDENVVVCFSNPGREEETPVSWGFPTITHWRKFLEACQEFDKKISNG